MTEECKDEMKVKGEDLLRKVKELIHQGNIREIIIKDKNGTPYIKIPLTLGVVGVVLAPVLAAVGALAALASDFTIEVQKKE